MSDVWVEVVVEKAPGQNYFYNRETEQVSWQRPDGVTIIWRMHTDAAERTYYKNVRSGERVWSLPSATGRQQENHAQHQDWSATDLSLEDACRRRLIGHMASLSSVLNRSSEASSLFPGSNIDLLFECLEPMDASMLFPSGFAVASLPDDPPVCAGYLVVDLAASLADADESSQRLAHAWWEVAQASALFATLVFATCLQDSGRDSENKLVSVHRRLAYKAPAPLVFAGFNKEWESKAKAESEWWEEAGAEDYDYDHDEEEEDQDHNFTVEEDKLFDDIKAYLRDGPREVQDLAANYAPRFNEAVRMNPNNNYNAGKKNDGSFKKWLCARGLDMGEMYDRNKCMASLPASMMRKARERKRGKTDKSHFADAEAVECEPFQPPYGAGTKEATQLENEASRYIDANGAMDMGALRAVNNLGARFNNLFWQKAKVNNGSWKKWLASLPGIEVCVDPKSAEHHGNQPTIVRPKSKR